jgi:hypothetical protein
VDPTGTQEFEKLTEADEKLSAPFVPRVSEV